MEQMNIYDKIIQYIEKNKISSTNVADCMDKTGGVCGAMPLIRGLHKVGKVAYVYGYCNTNWPIHDQIRYIGENAIVFVDDIKFGEKALFGELVSWYIYNVKKATAIVTQGNMRDITELLAMNAPMWLGGISPEGSRNVNIEPTEEIKKIAEEHRRLYEGGIAICDDCGVVIIPAEQVTEEMYEKIVALSHQEKVWSHCIMDLNWSTFDTVCLKKYKGTEIENIE